MSPQIVLGQPSWRIAMPEVEAFVTRTGGHLGPVRVKLGDRTVEPFSVAPWAEERDGLPHVAMLRALRGDFFCLPFGGYETSSGEEKHPAHGDTANLDWTLESLSPGEIHLSLKTRSRPGRVDKRVRIEGTTIYQTHTISGMAGPMPVGHHAMLRFPSEGRLSTGAILGGRVFPGAFERPEEGGYTSLIPGGAFDDLRRVPMANGGFADLTAYPAREGFEDLVQIHHPPGEIAWNAIVVDGYAWIALKDPRVLPSTVLWHSNGGRHYTPWRGRHRRVLGVEDVCAYFHYGLAESSAPNDSPVPTCLRLNPSKPTEIRYVMAVVAVPEGFERVVRVEAGRLVGETAMRSNSASNGTFSMAATLEEAERRPDAGFGDGCGEEVGRGVSHGSPRAPRKSRGQGECDVLRIHDTTSQDFPHKHLQGLSTSEACRSRSVATRELLPLRRFRSTWMNPLF